MSNSKEESTNNSLSFEVLEVKDTPFNIVGNEEDGYRIVMGNQQVCKETFENVKKANDYIKKKPYELIMVSCMVYIEKVNELKEQTKVYEENKKTEN